MMREEGYCNKVGRYIVTDSHGNKIPCDEFPDCNACVGDSQ